MSDIRGHLEEVGNSTVWHPLSTIKIGNEYILKVSDTSSASAPGTPKHYNGVANVISAQINFTALTKDIYIENMDTVNNLLISFDSGVNNLIILPGKSIQLKAAVNLLDISSNAIGTQYQILTTE